MMNAEEALISHCGRVLRYNLKSNRIQVEHEYRKGMKNPLSFCVRKLDSGEKEIYYGEYIWNENKGPVAIYRCKDGSWQKVYEFAENMITHIHSVVFDSSRETFFILTGDSDSESGIWIADNQFRNMRPLLVGKQKYRACVAFPTKAGLLYATDTPLEQNYVYLLSLEDEANPKITEIGKLPGSCIYGAKVNEKYYFSTTVEPDSTLTGWRYRITNKLGKGIQDRYSYLVSIEEQGELKICYRQKKDFLPMWLFQFGNMLFPYNETNQCYIVQQALRHKHNVTLRSEE